jgi:hypothetical protein
MALFEGYERRIAQITPYLAAAGIESLEKAEKICLDKGVDVRKIVKGIQNISFENAGWAYLIGAAVAITKKQTVAAEIAETLGTGLQAFCIPGSLPMIARSVSAMAIWPRCCCAKRLAASLSALATNRLPRLKAQSAWPAPRITLARLPCA